MKPVVVIGLGNPLMGDDGIGWHVAERLATDPRLPSGVEAIQGGTDLLRCAARIEGRRRAILIVPSVLAPTESNWLINPRHPAFERIRVHPAKPFQYDSRFFR